MEFDESNITNSYTGAEIEKYEKILYKDDNFDCYMVHFKNGYRLEIDRDEITEDDINWLIKNKIKVDIEIKLSVWKGRVPEESS